MTKKRKIIGIMVGTFNEVENVKPLYEEIKQIFETEITEYDFNILFIDNASQDGTQEVLAKLATDKRVKVIFNTQNFGPNRSAYHGMVNAPGDAVIMMCADFQDPPALIPNLVAKWTEGQQIVMARKRHSQEGLLFAKIRSGYYWALRQSNGLYSKISNCTGFGIYDRNVIQKLQTINDPNPFFRGIIAEIAGEIAFIDYDRPERRAGKSNMNFLALWDEGIVGLINNSRIMIRLMSICGLALAFLSLSAAVITLVLKLMFWDSYNWNSANHNHQFTLLGILMMCVGVLGEYVGAIYIQTLNRDRVHEKKRLNF